MAERAEPKEPRAASTPAGAKRTRSRAQVELRNSYANYVQLLEATLDALVVVDSDGRVTIANCAAERMFGYRREEIIGEPVEALIPERFRQSHVEHCQTYASRPYARPMGAGLDHLVGRRKDGSEFPIDVALSPLELEGSVLITAAIHDITERKGLEETLREREERYQKIFQEGPLGVAIVSLDYRLVDVNARLCEMLGYRREELTALTFPDITYPEDVETDVELAQRLFSGEIPYYQVEKRYIKKNNEIFWGSLTATVIRDREGEPLYGLGMVEDVTERKRAEEALREWESRFRSTLDNMLEGCQIIGFDWRYLYVNDAVATQGRRAKEELQGHTMMETYAGIEDTEMFGFLRRCMEERIPHHMENDYTFPDGSKGWFELSMQPVPEGVLILSWDITERKEAEEALRESEHKFRLLAENIAEVFWLFDPKGYQVLYVSPAYDDLWGRTCESLYEDPRSWLAAVHPADIERVSAALEKQAETGEFDEEFRIIRSDGSIRHVWDRGIAVKDESGQVQHVVGVAADITDRKRLEQEVQRAREELEGKVERQMLGKNPYGLTFREFTVLHHVAAGKADKEIARELGISPLTASKHVANILGKMNASSRTDAGVRAVREGLLD